MMPLGKPLAKAPVSADGFWMTRNFSSGTSMEWDVEANDGVIHWARVYPDYPVTL